MNEPPLVRIAANCVQRMIYQYRDDFLAGMIVAGWDKKLGGQVSASRVRSSRSIDRSIDLGLLVPSRWFARSTIGDLGRFG